MGLGGQEADVVDGFFSALRPSYVYLTLASALVSFGLALTLFFVCR